MLIIPFGKRKCLRCGRVFTPKTYRHLYCRRKCYMRTYHELAKGHKYPDYVCPNCGYKTKLTFNIKKKYQRWINFSCPNCGTKTIENVLNNREMVI